MDITKPLSNYQKYYEKNKATELAKKKAYYEANKKAINMKAKLKRLEQGKVCYCPELDIKLE